MTDVLFDSYGHPVNILVDPAHPQRLFDDYGRPYIVVKDASGLDLAAANAISVLARRGVWMPGFTCECVETWNIGSGAGWPFFNGRTASSGTVAESSHISSGSIVGGRGLSIEQYNWDKASVFHFSVIRKRSDAEVIARTQFKTDTYPPTTQQLAGSGIGLEVRDLALYGESYGQDRFEVDLNTTLTDDTAADVLIIHLPQERIEWHIDGVLKAVQTEISALPAGTHYMNICNSIKNGESGGVDARYYFSGLTIWRAL